MSSIEAPAAKLNFNPFDRRLIADPYPEYNRLRAAEPVHWNELLQAWVLTGLDEVRTVLTDQAFRAIRTSAIVSELARKSGRDWPELVQFIDAVLFFKEGPGHERDRRTLSKVVNRIKLSHLEAVVQEFAREVAEPLRGRTEFDIIADFADPFPHKVMAYILGIPMEDVPVLSALISELTLVFDPASISTYERANTQVAVALELVQRRIRESAPDTALRTIYEGSGGEGEEKLKEAAAITLFSYRVGAETTIGLIGLMMKIMMEQPELRAALLADRDLIETMVNEVLRVEANVQRVVRTAVEPRRIGGVDIAEGDRLLLLLGAANRDPAAFDPPEHVGLGGQQTTDLAFGAGKHFCLGASLARLEGRVALSTFLDLPELELAGEPAYYGGRSIRRLTTLPVRTVAAARSG